MGTLAIVLTGLSVALVMGFVEPLASDTISTLMRAGIIAVSLVTVVIVGRTVDRSWAMLLCGTIAFLMPVMFSEGRWLAYLSGWNGLEIDRFLSALGEMPVSAGEAQALALIFGGFLGVPYALAGAVIGWIVGRRPAPAPKGAIHA